MGLDPMMTLFLLYLGFKIRGISGMILAVPVGILVSLVWFAVFWIVGRKQFERQVQL